MSSVYARGTPINLVQRFWLIDPLTEEAVLADPTTVTFTVKDPDDVKTAFVFGIDLNVTNPAVGIYVCALDPQLPIGVYGYDCVGTGAVESASSDWFEVIQSTVQTNEKPGVAVSGPCSPWINGEDVAACGPDLGVGSEVWRLDDAAYDASWLLYALSGRQYPGVCSTTRRPCQSDCGCWDGIAGYGGTWWWGSIGGWNGGGWGVGPNWVNDYGGTCGCGGTSVVRLAGYPIREIVEVKIDGVVFPEFDVDTGARNWRLDRAASELTRMWTPNGNSPFPQSWPGCQNMSLDDDQPGTFAITYKWGADVPSLGRMAAAQLARELWAACTGGTCKLPSKVTRVVRNGVTIDRVQSIAEMLRTGSSGIPLVDAFIAAQPAKMSRSPAIFSPDVQQFAQEVGQ